MYRKIVILICTSMLAVCTALCSFSAVSAPANPPVAHHRYHHHHHHWKHHHHHRHHHHYKKHQ